MQTEVSKTKMIRCKTLHPIRLQRNPHTGVTEEHVIKEGVVVELTEAEAKEFCEIKFDNARAYSGERFKEDGDANLGKIVRAVRV